MDEKTLLPLLSQLADVGIWIQRRRDGELIVGPAHLAHTHAELIAHLRPHKQTLSKLIESQLAHALFGDADDDPRFATALCPLCQQRVYVMAPDEAPRQLAGHRYRDGRVCPGGGRAAQVSLDSRLQAFLHDRCVQRPGALLTFTSLWASFKAWSYSHQLLPLPTPEHLQEAMTQRYTPSTMAHGPAWGSIMLKLPGYNGFC